MKKYLKYLLVGVLWINTGGLEAIAQDGAAIFKSKCGACHNLDKKSIGPMLQGVKAKWAEAGESELLYDWVKNSEALLETGSSTMATEVEEFSITAMPAQEVTNEEVDAILDYIDAYVAPEPEPETEEAEEAEIPTVPNYNERLNLFYALVASIILLLLVILGMSKSTQALLKSDYFRSNLKDPDSGNTGGLKALLLLIAVGGLLSPSVSALSFPDPANLGEDTPWLTVEMADIYALVVINVVLVGVILYLKKIFSEAMKLADPVSSEDATETYVESDVMPKVNKIMTDAVPIEDEASILMDHEFDGIRELDNNLPPWWVWMFYATIAFSVIYIFNYHIIGTADLQIEAYENNMAQAETEVQQYLESMAMNVDETNVTFMEDASDISNGKELFNSNCITCHAENGGGDIGPNLTDKSWIYGFDIATVFGTIKNGTSAGMPEHKSKLNPIELQQVSSYVLSIDEVKGKAPEGDVVEK